MKNRRGSFRAALLLLIAAVGTAAASDASWNWVWTTPDYNRSDNSRIWSTTGGTTSVKIVGNRFTVHLEDKAGDPDFDINGVITGNRVVATIHVMDTDDDPQRYTGTIVSDHGALRIALTSKDGDFIGLIAARPSN